MADGSEQIKEAERTAKAFGIKAIKANGQVVDYSHKISSVTGLPILAPSPSTAERIGGFFGRAASRVGEEIKKDAPIVASRLKEAFQKASEARQKAYAEKLAAEKLKPKADLQLVSGARDAGDTLTVSKKDLHQIIQQAISESKARNDAGSRQWGMRPTKLKAPKVPKLKPGQWWALH